MTFSEITVEDAKWARPLLSANGYESCEYTFVNVYMWSAVYRTKIARVEDFVISRSEDNGNLIYLFPPGNGDVRKAIDAIIEDATQMGKTAILFSMNEECKNNLEAWYPGRFTITKPRGQADYVYLSSDLAQLPGKKYQKKRNHCSRFERQYPNWAFHEITPDALESVCSFNNRWCRLYDNRDDEGIEMEHKAIELACSHYDELNLKGGYVTVDGEVVAFSFGSPLSPDIFVTHVEKALYDVSGAYNIINREMARNFGQPYTYINRENDVDEEGLREAKLSYHPHHLEEKYNATLIR